MLTLEHDVGSTCSIAAACSWLDVIPGSKTLNTAA